MKERERERERQTQRVETKTVAYRLDVETQNVLHVGRQLVHHREVAEHTGPVCAYDCPHARRLQDADPRHAMPLPSDTSMCIHIFHIFPYFLDTSPVSSLIVMAPTWSHPHLLARSCVNVSLYVKLTSPARLTLLA